MSETSSKAEKAQEFLSTLKANYLSFAEQKLLQAGLTLEDLRRYKKDVIDMANDIQNKDLIKFKTE